MNLRKFSPALPVLCMLILVGCGISQGTKVDSALLGATKEPMAEHEKVNPPGATQTPLSMKPDPSPTKVKSQFLTVEKTPTQAPPSPTPTPEFKICSPLAPYRIDELREIVSAPYKPPPPGKEERHHGVDFSHYRRGELLSIEGVVVQAVLPGLVSAAIADSFPYGNVIIIETPTSLIPDSLRQSLDLAEGQSLYTLYAHLKDTPQVNTGDIVYACQEIGQVGKSGNTVEPHLHLETRIGPSGVTFIVMGFYQADNSEEEKEAYLRWRIGGEFNHFDPMSLLLLSSRSGE